MKPSANDPTSELDKHLKRALPNLERDKVVAVALELLNEVGFEGLTLRRLADKLGVKAAALYWHFENKQDLIDTLAGQIIENEFKGGDREAFEAAAWRELLTTMGQGMRTALRRYRDGALVIANADLARNKSFKGRGMLLQKLVAEGFPPELALSSLFAVGRFTLGCVFEEQADPHSKEELEQLATERSNNIVKEFPEMKTIFKAVDPVQIMDPDYQFNQGLEIILAGVEYSLAKSKR